MKKLAGPVILVLALVFFAGWRAGWFTTAAEPQTPDPSYPEVEARLRPLARKLDPPKPGDWLARHEEPGQTFAEYVNARPVRKSDQLKTIYLCLVGDFTDEQKKVMQLTREYMEIVFAVPVKVHKELPLARIPERAKRVHPSWGDRQVLTTYVLDEVLKPERPDDALAYLAFTASDLWPGENWNFVFGQASLRERTGVWSIYRNGDPGKGEADFRRCLLRTLKVASHETGHILTMYHCTAFECNMNGSNSLVESDRQPLPLCPVCLRKICWNLQVEPTPYLKKLEAFCRKHDLTEEADRYGKAIEALGAGNKE